MNLAEKISNAELEIMKILWRSDLPVSSTDIRRELLVQKSWEKSTVLTLLRRLTDKSVITVQKQSTSYYSPNISEDEYTAYHTQNMVDKLYHGNVKSLVAALCQDNKLTEADIDELKSYFKMEGDK